jgi:hypothetical protein
MLVNQALPAAILVEQALPVAILVEQALPVAVLGDEVEAAALVVAALQGDGNGLFFKIFKTLVC